MTLAEAVFSILVVGLFVGAFARAFIGEDSWPFIRCRHCDTMRLNTNPRCPECGR